MNDPIKTIQRQTQRYWYIDGLNEIGAGILILLLGLLYWLEWLLNSSPAAGMLTGIGQPILVICGWLIINWAVKIIKARITYPRTGYVAYRQEKGGRRVRSALVAFGLAAVIAFAAFFLGQTVGDRLIPVLIGLMMAGAVVYLGYFFDLRRFYLLALVGLVLSTAGVWFIMPQDVAMAVFLIGFGIAWIVSGAVTLFDYLRRTQPVIEEEG